MREPTAAWWTSRDDNRHWIVTECTCPFTGERKRMPEDEIARLSERAREAAR